MPSRTASLSNVFPVFLHAKLSKDVEVRLMYDDVGSVSFINRSFIKRCARWAFNAKYLILYCLS